ncbi:MAG: hypothetical protein QN193_09140 [Armatimonadota bacterium]|nr:hypothetical protein [Armatimonadota bacterium]MDR7444401.1 hypothetical protein [Armatimonadota bacterium]MDR7570757.1 hypothetical protein [Armatimonadota bacterium]MDR7614887.1 hypothetical protein [Armatimonadota bacterium]
MEAYRVHVLVSAAEREGRFAYGIVIRSGRGRVLRQLGRAVEGDDVRGVLLRAVLRALWIARRYGRTIRVALDHPEVVRWLSHAEEVAPQFLGTYLQIRALVHTYRRVDVGVASEEERSRSQRVARHFLGEPTRPADSPLWTGSCASIA